VEDLRAGSEEVVEEHKRERVCKHRVRHEHERYHSWKTSIERAEYQSRWHPHRGKWEAEVKLDGNTVRGWVHGAREGRHKRGEVCCGDNETAWVHGMRTTTG